MNSTFIVKPIEVDGIEFYVSPTGEAGMSITGLARLCGVAESTVRGVIKRLQGSREIASKTAESPEISRLEVRELNFNTLNNARVLSSDFCADLIEHYAFDSQTKNETARYSYRKFAKMGITKWIHQVTGYAQAEDMGALMETMQAVLVELKELRVEVKDYKVIQGRTKDDFEGLGDLLEELADDTEVKALPGADADGYWTIAEWLGLKGISLDRSRLHRLASLTAYTYRTLTKRDPRLVYRESTKKGNKTKKVNGYTESEFPILNIALTKLLQP